MSYTSKNHQRKRICSYGLFIATYRGTDTKIECVLTIVKNTFNGS